MNKDVLLGIDIGTESARAAVFDFKGNLIASSQKRCRTFYPEPGYAEQNPIDWWQITLKNLRDLKNYLSSVIGIGVCGQMHAPVSITKQGELLTNRVQLWCDKRGANYCEKFRKKISDNKTISITGNVILPSWMGVKINWIKNNQKDIYDKTYKFLTPKDYINFKLTGKIAIDYSEASGTFLMDINTMNWSNGIARYMDISIDKMPDIYSSEQIIGHITEKISSLTGLKKGTPVVAGGGDMLCSLLGGGMVEYEDVFDITGTAAIICAMTKSPLINQKIMNIHHVIDAWVPFGILDSGGGSYQWFKNTFCKLEEESVKKSGKSIYDILTKEAKNITAGANGLLFLPYLIGERVLGDSNSRGIFFGISQSHTRAHLIRAILEGVIFDMRQTLEIFEKSGIKIKDIITIGGGAKEKVWSQIKADVYKKNIVVLEKFEGGVLGAAVLAGLGVKVFNNVVDACAKMNKIKERFKPIVKNSFIYDKFYEIFKDLHDSMQSRFRKLNEVTKEEKICHEKY